MENRDDILNELKEISPAVAGIGNSNLFAVPEGYFDSLPGMVLLELHKPSFQNSYRLPDGYFNGLANDILAKIKSAEVSNPVLSETDEELQTVAPLLLNIGRDNVYAAPSAYFEAFKVNIDAPKQVPAKIISLGSKTRKWITYAAAAMIAGVIATGTFLFVNNQDTSTFQKPSSLRTANDDVTSLSDDDINNYLSNQRPATDFSPVASSDDVEIDGIINNTSDEEINQYLMDNQEPTPKKI